MHNCSLSAKTDNAICARPLHAIKKKTKSMDIKNLIANGYFPKELPPPFQSIEYGKEADNILNAWKTIFTNNTDIKNTDVGLVKLSTESKSQFKSRKREKADKFIQRYRSSKCTLFSIAKGKFGRRPIQIPNPKNFITLSNEISNNWQELNNVYQTSLYSQSIPVELGAKRAVRTKSKGVSEFRNKLVIESYNYLFETKVDISKFYPTIYTHSIAWGLLGYEKSKEYFLKKEELSNQDWKTLILTDNYAKLYQIADKIDMNLRNCQDRQSIGIPIGPDTSHIIAEIIACRIDKILETESDIELQALRFYDDYSIFTKSKSDAEKVLKFLQKTLNKFQLEINESKIKILVSPTPFDDNWAIKLNQFNFTTSQRNSLRNYFSLVFEYANKNQNKSGWIIQYALRTFEWGDIRVSKKNWELLESILLKVALFEPSALKGIVKIFITYQTYFHTTSKDKIKNVIEQLIETHLEINHHFEVAWSLWFARTFEIQINQNLVDKIIQSEDSISKLIILDLYSSGVIPLLNSTKIKDLCIDRSLFNENWLLAYEAVKKGWINPSDTSLLDKHEFFKLLKDKGIEFYDLNKQITPSFDIKKEKKSILSKWTDKIKDLLNRCKSKESDKNIGYDTEENPTDKKDIINKPVEENKDIPLDYF
jgi:hypothetical protein